MHTKTLWIRDEYLNHILDGTKTIEVRVAYPNIARLQPGDRLLLNDRYRYQIGWMFRYTDFDELLSHEDPAAIAPGLDADALLAALRTLYPSDKEALGVIALHIEPEPRDAIE